jgi:hypothetical protein
LLTQHGAQTFPQKAIVFDKDEPDSFHVAGFNVGDGSNESADPLNVGDTQNNFNWPVALGVCAGKDKDVFLP